MAPSSNLPSRWDPAKLFRFRDRSRLPVTDGKPPAAPAQGTGQRAVDFLMNPVILEVREEQQQSRLLFCPEGLIGICYLNRLILVEQDRILEGGGSSIVKIRI